MRALEWREIHISDPIGQPPSAYVRLRAWLLRPVTERVLVLLAMAAIGVVGCWLVWVWP